ncbi:MAG TPA: hypothetical protein VGP38_12435 [Rubrobacter sp.]|nr:hypothetical protein [Rubrobacter sp.]
MSSPTPPGKPGEPLSPESRRRVLRAALLRPLNVLVVIVGSIFFALTLAWWAIPLTLATYAALVYLAVNDPLFQSYILLGRPRIRPAASRTSDLSPEQRARRLPLGETRQKIEAALEVQRRIMLAIRESDEDTKILLNDAVPKLNRVAEHLAEVAEDREKLAGEIQALETRAKASHPSREGQDTDAARLAEVEDGLRATDAEVSGAVQKLLNLRARVVRVSTETGGAAQGEAARLNADLDEMNLRLDALHSRMSALHSPDR